MKRYRFEFSRHADRLFGKLPKNIQKRILAKLAQIESLEKPLFKAKKLKGMADRYSFRIGEYRVIVTKNERGRLVILIILTVGHRREVYEG